MPTTKPHPHCPPLGAAPFPSQTPPTPGLAHYSGPTPRPHPLFRPHPHPRPCPLFRPHPPWCCQEQSHLGPGRRDCCCHPPAPARGTPLPALAPPALEWEGGTKRGPKRPGWTPHPPSSSGEGGKGDPGATAAPHPWGTQRFGHPHHTPRSPGDPVTPSPGTQEPPQGTPAYRRSPHQATQAFGRPPPSTQFFSHPDPDTPGQPLQEDTGVQEPYPLQRAPRGLGAPPSASPTPQGTLASG